VDVHSAIVHTGRSSGDHTVALWNRCRRAPSAGRGIVASTGEPSIVSWRCYLGDLASPCLRGWTRTRAMRPRRSLPRTRTSSSRGSDLSATGPARERLSNSVECRSTGTRTVRQPGGRATFAAVKPSKPWGLRTDETASRDVANSVAHKGNRRRATARIGSRMHSSGMGPPGLEPGTYRL
jgi:hypothetical protein